MPCGPRFGAMKIIRGQDDNRSGTTRNENQRRMSQKQQRHPYLVVGVSLVRIVTEEAHCDLDEFRVGEVEESVWW